MDLYEVLAVAAGPVLLIFWATVLGLLCCGLAGALWPSWRASRHVEQRAATLLKEWLSPPQLADYEKEKHFEVIGSHTGKRYRIRHGRQANIVELDDRGMPSVTWCFVPDGDLATGDIVLAQKIALENNERAAMKIANKVSGDRDERLTAGAICDEGRSGRSRHPRQH